MTTLKPFTGFEDMHDLDDAEMRAPKTVVVEKVMCPKCGGLGQVRYGFTRSVYYPCGMCKGEKIITAERVNRYNGAKKAAVTREKNLSVKLNLFREEHPEVMTWLENSNGKFEFATSLFDNLMTYGKLSERQIEAAKNCIQKAKDARSSKEQQRLVILDDNAKNIHATLERASGKGLTAPSLRANGLKFQLAKATSRNPGAVYVTEKSVYMGKITPDGKFSPVRECSEDVKEKVIEVAKDPLKAAIEHGKKTGKCSCCGRELTDPESVKLGIGPICMDNYF